jgi:hypothetical protein
LLVLVSGCPAEDDGTQQACSGDDDCASLGMGYVCDEGMCVAPAATSGSETAATEPQTEDTGEEGTSTSGTTMAPTSGDPTTTPGTTVDPNAGDCDPDAAPFQDLRGVLRNSVSFDFGAGTCAVTQLDGQDPQILFEVRQTTGRVDATGFGIEITESNLGQVFAEPPMGDSQVIDLPIDLPVSFTGMSIADGTPLTFEFEISPAGPALVDGNASFE